MERSSRLLFILLFSTAPSAVAATPILLFQMLGTGPLEVRVDFQGVDNEKSWQQSDLFLSKKNCPIEIGNIFFDSAHPETAPFPRFLRWATNSPFLDGHYTGTNIMQIKSLTYPSPRLYSR